MARIRGLVGQALEIRRLMEVPVELPKPGGGNSELIGRSAAMQEVYKAVGRVAADVTVLIRGESGTGKELVARAIYQHSAAAQGSRFWRSTARRCPRRCWKASCSATKRARSPAPTSAASASSSSAPAARSSSTKSATCRR